jgi:hypothetical protein
MAKKQDQTVIWIAAAAILYWLWKTKSGKQAAAAIAPGSTLSPVERSVIKQQVAEDMANINIMPMVDPELEMKQQYQNEINNC